MRTSTQLLSSIVGNTIVALLLFGSAAYLLFLDHHVKYQKDTLEHIAGIISDDWQETSPYSELSTYLDYAHGKYASSDAIFLILDGDTAKVIPDTMDVDENTFNDVMTSMPDVLSNDADNHVAITLGKSEYLWTSIDSPVSDHKVLLLEPVHKNWTNSDLSARLLLTFIGCVWLAVWVALILSSKISRKLNEKNEALRNQAIHDSLTGLPNRILLMDRLSQMLLEANRSNMPFSLLLLDLDNFKELNDTLGHHYGDLLLQKIATTLKQSVRADDTVARLGGDEFAILLHGANHAGAETSIKAILKALRVNYRIKDTTIQACASLGVAIYPQHGSTAEELIQHADVAMYQSKRADTDYEIYNKDFDTHSLRRLHLMNELQSSMKNNHFSVYYQPLVDQKTGITTSVEALARWEHPEMGFVSPEEFIPVIEHTGTIRKLTTYVLKQAIHDCREWQKAGYDLGLSVNISPRCLRDKSFPEMLVSIVEKAGMATTDIELEITESALMNDISRAEETLAQLNDLGFKLAIDDFGTGFSSLHRLKQLPVDTLKIDKSFILDIGSNKGSRAIVLSIIELAHNFNCRVVAEGVENDSILEILQGLKTDYLQGYLFTRPLPRAEFEVWMKQSSWKPQRATLKLIEGGIRE